MAKEQEKVERFKRVAKNRTNRITNQIRLLGNCANKSIYEHSDKDIKKIFLAIDTELKETKLKYQEKTKSKKFEL